MSRGIFYYWRGVAVLALLSACGGDTSQSASSEAGTIQTAAQFHSEEASAAGLTVTSSRRLGAPAPDSESATLVLAQGMTVEKASRFLGQATFGPNLYDIQELAQIGYSEWFSRQFKMPQKLHRSHVQARLGELPQGSLGGEDQFYESFWKQVVTGDDQLRQRVAYALSQIFVVSFQDGVLANNGRAVASFYDVLGKHAFGNFRDLLQDVATHPAMGIYLSFLKNQKESETRNPDENFARELMQLMTIGLYEMNQDGTLKYRNGKPIETYSQADVAGLAKVFTGWSWYGPDKSYDRFFGMAAHPNRDWQPMQNYPEFHSTAVKQVLGRPITAGSGEAELSAALDRLFNHANVGPFIGRQLIQRLVKSNPSPAYIGRVAAAFNNNGYGVRGDMKAVVQAVLMDSEARNISADPLAGKIREPVLRLSHWMRAFYSKSKTGNFRMWQLDDLLFGIAQTPMRAPSVFNFYRPDYVPPRTDLAASSSVAPEMQITAEPSVVGYLNVMQNVIEVGIGKDRDILPDYQREMALVERPEALVDRLNLVLLGGQMSPELRQQVLDGINSIRLLPATAPREAREYARTHRVYAAIYLIMVSPEYIVQI